MLLTVSLVIMGVSLAIGVAALALQLHRISSKLNILYDATFNVAPSKPAKKKVNLWRA